MIVDGFGRVWFDPAGRPYMYMKQIFLSMTPGNILNFFAFQLLYCILKTCLICSRKMKGQKLRKNFMRFGSSSVCLFSYHQCFYTYKTFGHFLSII